MFACSPIRRSTSTRTQPPASVDALRARYAKLESRRSGDGREQWLNWVIRMDGAGLIGYVQATVHANGSAAIAYEMASAHWGRGLGRAATEAMSRSSSITTALRRSSRWPKRAITGRSACSSASASRAPARALRCRGVEPDETLMVRAAA
jgi:hypothetical protein